jgi:hypothetical protein
MLLVFVWLNRWSLAILIIGVGLAMNFTAMLANGGLMPVTIETIQSAGLEEKVAEAKLGDPLPRSKDVALRKEDARLWLLSDRFVVKNSPSLRIFSPGDVVIGLGLLTGLGEVLFYFGQRNRASSTTEEGKT